MQHNDTRFLISIHIITDGLFVLVAYACGVYLRFGLWLSHGFSDSVEWALEHAHLAVIYALIYAAFATLLKVYDGLPPQLGTGRRIFMMGISNLLAFSGVMAVMYFFHMQDSSRWMLILLCFFSTLFMTAKRLLTYDWLCSRNPIKYVAVVGNGKHARKYMEGITANPQCGIAVKGYFSAVPKDGLGECLGAYEDLEQVLLSDLSIVEIVLALELHETHYLQPITAAADKAGVQVDFIPFYTDYMPSNPIVTEVNGCKVINMRSIPLDALSNRIVKRLMDVCMAAGILALTSPILLIAAIGIKLSSPGPILFKQERIGLNRKPYTMFKLRTMHVNASSTTAWSKDVDPRRFWWGSLLRKTSVDELVQCVNVLMGTMSMIGPRPEIPHFVDQFKETIPLYMVKHQVLPGITGWAQVNGFRGDTSIEERINHDIWYIENWSLWLDVKIVLMTIFGGMVNKENIAVPTKSTLIEENKDAKSTAKIH